MPAGRICHLAFGSAVVRNTRDSRFESQHQQIFQNIEPVYCKVRQETGRVSYTKTFMNQSSSGPLILLLPHVFYTLPLPCCIYIYINLRVHLTHMCGITINALISCYTIETTRQTQILEAILKALGFKPMTFQPKLKE